MEAVMNGFWKNWLTVWCWGVIAFGAVLVLVAVPAADGPARLVYAMVGGGRPEAGMFDLPSMRFAFALQGALTIGWTLTMMGLVRAASVVGAPAWRALTLSLLVWFVIDSAASIGTGFPLNAVSNSVLLVSFLVPILATGVLRGGAVAMA
jgi:hypothetical protein